tara:strand:+ start:696 stop:935 length:240 start_codon:yes stop_codon:yes gene_type:complete
LELYFLLFDLDLFEKSSADLEDFGILKLVLRVTNLSNLFPKSFVKPIKFNNLRSHHKMKIIAIIAPIAAKVSGIIKTNE